jgi:peroxiredoxin
MHRSSLRPLLAAAALVAVAGAASAEVKPGTRAVDFERKSLDGQTVRLSALRGKVVLIDFWASWCEPCKAELPRLAELSERLRAHGVEIVTVNVDDDPKAAERFLASHDLHLTVVTDPDKKIVGAYEPEKMPSSYAIDRNGVVHAINGGFERGDETKIEKQLLALAGR